MKILISIGHPAHVHLFKNFIWIMRKKGHKILITVIKKDVNIELLKIYDFDCEILGKKESSVFRKIIKWPYYCYKLYRISKKFKQNIFLSTGDPYGALATKLAGGKSIAFDDTEHSIEQRLLYKPFTDVVCTPSCLKGDWGGKQVRYNGYHELAYLHPNYFRPDRNVLKELGIKEGERFFILRFIAWRASHDVGQSGLSMESKRKLVELLNKHGKVFISSEKELPEEFERYQIKIPPEKIHDALYYASMYVGEGAKMAAEAAILGTPSIFINSLVGTMGIFIDLENNYNLIYSFRYFDDAYDKVKDLLNKKNLKKEWQIKRQKLLKDKIDVTKWMINFVENCT